MCPVYLQAPKRALLVRRGVGECRFYVPCYSFDVSVIVALDCLIYAGIPILDSLKPIFVTPYSARHSPLDEYLHQRAV